MVLYNINGKLKYLQYLTAMIQGVIQTSL